MKVLMTTEKLDREDTIFAFSHLWVKTIAEQVDHLTVIALSVGTYDLPKNVTVYSLGKEKGTSTFERLRRFYTYIWKERKNYDAVFIHMNQIYVLLGGPLWKLLGKKIGLWYTHRQISRSLKLATKLVDYVFTAVDESFNIATPKKHILGHGIDTNVFFSSSRKEVLIQGAGDSLQNPISIVSVGRITRIKNIETLIQSVRNLKEEGRFVKVLLVGPTVTSDDDVYKKELTDIIQSLDIQDSIVFLGGKKAEEMRQILWQSDIHVNLCPTGGLDKAVIEAGCAGLHSVCANKAFISSYNGLDSVYIFEYANGQSLAKTLSHLIDLPRVESDEKRRTVQTNWLERFAVKTLISNMLKTLQS